MGMTKELAEIYPEVVTNLGRLFKAGWTLTEVNQMRAEMSLKYLVAEEDLDLLIASVQKKEKTNGGNKMTNVTKAVVGAVKAEVKAPAAKPAVKAETVKIGGPAKPEAKPAAKAEKKAAPKVDRENPKEGETWMILNYKGAGTGYIVLQGEVKGNDVDVRWSPRRRYFSEQKKHIVRPATPAEIKAKMAGETVKVELK